MNSYCLQLDFIKKEDEIFFSFSSPRKNMNANER